MKKTKTILSTKQILKKLKLADDAYYNTTKENKKYLMLDNEYDDLKEILERIYKEEHIEKETKVKVKKYLKSTGTKVRASKRDTVLPFHVKSLSKVTCKKVTKLKSILKMLPKPDYVIGPKLDGTSVTLKYENGQLVDGYTRGDGSVGQSKIDHLLTLKDIPHSIKLDAEIFYIRGELLVNKIEFDKSFKDKEYKEARNAGSGWINSDEIENPIRNIITFVAYEILGVDGLPLVSRKIKDKISALEFLNLNFKTNYLFNIINEKTLFHQGRTNNKTTELNYLVDDMEKLMVFFKKELPFEVDGLVFEVNNYLIRNTLDKGNTTKYPKFAIAYKQDAENEAKENGQQSKITDISKSVNKGGMLYPTIHFKPVLIGNTNVKQCSGKNFRDVYEKNMAIGNKISVVKAGGVIPAIFLIGEPKYKAEKVKECLCGAKSIMVGPHLYCSKPLKCIYCQKFNLETMLKRLKLIGLGNKNIQKLFDAGYTDLFSLLEAKESKLLKIEGFGDSIITTIKRGIPEKLKTLSEAALMDCSGVFMRAGLSLAEKTLKDILNGKTTSGERYDLYIANKSTFKEWKKKLKTFL